MLKAAMWTAIALSFGIACQGTRAQTPIPPSAQDFVMAAMQSDQYEILAAHVAEVQGQNSHVQAFAKDMIRDHTRLFEDLRHAALASGLEVPASGMSSEEAALLSSLQGLRGAEFDRTYVRQQVLAHTQAVAVEESFGEAGADPNVRKAVQAALPTVRDHLKAANQLRAEVNGE